MTTKNIKYSETLTYVENGEKYQMDIDIELNDECKNGHTDFSMTGSIYRVKNERKYEYMGGCIHDEILKKRPQYQIFESLHMCDFNGFHTYTSGSGFYHLKRTNPEEFCKYFNITKQQYDKIYFAEDEIHFKYLIESTDIIQSWKELADRAIRILEEKTGLVFDRSEERRSNYTYLTAEEKELIETRLKEGFYTAENMAKRAKEAIDKAIAKRIKESKERREKEAKRGLKDHRMLEFILGHFGNPQVNYIWYDFDHKREVCFNWSYVPEGAETTTEQIEGFADHIRTLKEQGSLPQFITLPLVLTSGKDSNKRTVTTIY